MRPSQDTREPGICGRVKDTGQQTLKKKIAVILRESKLLGTTEPPQCSAIHSNFCGRRKGGKARTKGSGW